MGLTTPPLADPPHSVPPAQRPAPTGANTPAAPTIDPKVQKAADEFEAMVIGQLLAPMFNTVSASGPFGGGEGEEMFSPMLVDEYAKSMAKAGGIGIAASIAKELRAFQNSASASAPETGAAGNAAAVHRLKGAASYSGAQNLQSPVAALNAMTGKSRALTASSLAAHLPDGRILGASPSENGDE